MKSQRVSNKLRILVTGGSGFIGTHLVNILLKKNVEIVNVDIQTPKIPSHNRYWNLCDIKNLDELALVFAEFKPTHAVHLAAKANLDGDSIDDFPDNIMGTKNVVQCVNQTREIMRLVHTSSQYTVMPGILPETDEILRPYTAYGKSKAESERIVRKRCSKPWMIIRPTNIWGPMHPNFPNEMWPYLAKRYYFHPGFAQIKKYYGYVENAVDQIVKLGLDCKGEDVCGKVFYITDAPIDSADWLNGFSLMLSGKPMRRIPKTLWYLLALMGDALTKVGIKSPITSERFFRLSVNEAIPYQKTIDLTGKSAISLNEGIARSVAWFKAISDGKSQGYE